MSRDNPLSLVTSQMMKQNTASSLSDACRGTTGVILAGGRSRRMGTNKALLDIEGQPLIEKVYKTMSSLFSQVVLITNTPEEYTFLPCRSFPDIYPNVGCIAGIHTGLQVSPTDTIFVVPCDMPFLSAELIRRMCALSNNFDAVVPVSFHGVEPLHAVYHRSCVEQLKTNLKKGRKHLRPLLRQIRTRYVSVFDSQMETSHEPLFCNLNYPRDYEELQHEQVFNL